MENLVYQVERLNSFWQRIFYDRVEESMKTIDVDLTVTWSRIKSNWSNRKSNFSDWQRKRCWQKS